MSIENGPKKEFIRPRLKLEKVVDFKQPFPEKIPKKLLKIGKTFDRFEDIALSTDYLDSKGQLDLTDLMEIEGALNAELASDIETIGKQWQIYVRSMELHFIGYPDGQRMMGKHMTVVDDQYNNFLRKLISERRPIFQKFAIEAVQLSYLYSLIQTASHLDLQEFIEQSRKNTHTPEQRALIDWVAISRLLRATGKPPELDLPHKDAFELLRDCEFSKGVTAPFVIQSVTFHGTPIKGRIRIYPAQNPLALAVMELINPHNNDIMANAVISRLTGELVPDGMQVISGKVAFDAINRPEVYTLLRDIAINELFTAVTRGEIRDKEYVTINEAEQTTTTIRPVKIRRIVPVDIQPTPSETLPEPVAEISVHREEVEKSDAVHEPSIAEQLAAINTTNEKTKQEVVVRQESRLTWRRIMRALKRIGVEIDLSTTHPKLKYERATTRFLNSHESDTGRNKHELYRALKELNIDRDRFFAALN
ncbi:MAG: hypothetical protein UY72_C0001G0022 [Candidatus Uhrbacteria bacterium GW2011_GWD2_52_7]|uniref:Uncharacterized protein n=1 Tax=Candidatus Uhrbacteria bacterium GW2011_GWD2_52_7 TaxID=1618989 RepID=A0A0G1XJ23_9BACT|nr:MAG: hypothetical protein UY72_C0001G0022 [Candidatus Uhrbacteria bacterium GW2011_GWD2_52_7]